MLNTADICVNPDRANDMNDRSTMNKIMEYMALGKPVVQFDLTEGRVSAGEASWYARPNDVADLAQKMVALLGDEKQRIHMGAIGRERVERELSWQHEAPRLLAAYEQSARRKIMKKFLLACCIIVALAWATGAMAQDANYTVKPGDMLSISVWKEPDLQTAGARAARTARSRFRWSARSMPRARPSPTSTRR